MSVKPNVEGPRGDAELESGREASKQRDARLGQLAWGEMERVYKMAGRDLENAIHNKSVPSEAELRRISGALETLADARLKYDNKFMVSSLQISAGL